jgi:dihydrofolate reductase
MARLRFAGEHRRDRHGPQHVGGGASVAQQYLRAGLIDDLQINLVPVLLGAGKRLFDNLAGADVRLEPVAAVAAPDVTHPTYRVRR